MTTLKSGFVTLLGLPNAGKSSFLNALVGENLAIVTPKAQTTWQLLRGYVTLDDLQMVVTDTPGLQEGTKALNAAMAKNSARALTLARAGNELVALMFDAADIGSKISENKRAMNPKPLDLERLGLGAIKKVLERECGRLPLKLPVIPTFNKSDLIRKDIFRKEIEEAVLPLLGELFASCSAPIWISTRQPKTIDAWIEMIKDILPMMKKGELFEEDALSDQNVRDFAGEFVREQCFMQLGAEVPYSIAVQIETFKEEKDLTRIEATLHVERESQKAMVIGKGGEKIKAIGSKARLKIEKLVGGKVYLGLKVKITPHWAREKSWVERFGYGERN